MIVEFSVKNFRSIKDLQTLSFVTTGLKSSEKNKLVDENNVVRFDELSLFKTLGIYGANASGKSNIIKAFDYFLNAISAEPSSKSNLSDLCSPFLYQKNRYDQESFFQIVFLLKRKKYRYGFTVKINPIIKIPVQNDRSEEIITNEWLYGSIEKNIVSLFIRKGKEIITNKLPNKGSIPKEIPYQHTFYLKHVAAYDQKSICVDIRDKLRRTTSSNIELHLEKYTEITLRYLDDKTKENKQDLIRLLSVFNLDYDDIHLIDDNSHNPYGIVPLDKIYLTKSIKVDNEYIEVDLNMYRNESSGTQKLFDLCGMLLRVFNWNEPVILIIDEIDSNFHPALLIKLISLFNDKEINKSNSQLLFTSHDTNLMSPSIMRRDQFYFTEKNEDQSTRLYSLADLKGIRNDADFAKQYLAGFYGALPVLGNYKHEIEEHV